MNEPRQVNRQTLMTAFVEPVAAVSQVRVARIELAPGQRAGRHTHPCQVVGTVVAGEIRYQLDGEDPTILRQGDAFFEPAEATVLHFDNMSDEEPATFVAFYLLPEGEDRLIIMLDQPPTA